MCFAVEGFASLNRFLLTSLLMGTWTLVFVMGKVCIRKAVGTERV